MPDPIRIVHCLRAPVGGAFRHVCDLIATQREAGHQVGLICDSITGGDFSEMQLDALAGDLELGLVRLPMRRTPSLADLAGMGRAFRDLKTMAPHVVHGHGAKGGAYARLLGSALKLAGIRTRRFYSPHGGSLHYPRSSLAGRVFFTMEKAMEWMSDGICFVSHYEEDQYRAKVHTPRVAHRVVHNGLRRDELVPVEPAENARDFLFIGEFRDLKGPDVFLLALAEIAHTSDVTPTAHLVGPGDERNTYELMAAELGLADAVTFHGPLPAREAFSMARTVVVPSRAESLPYIVLEAIGAGVPLVTTRVGGIPEIFMGRESDLVAPGDVRALARAMCAKTADRAAALDAARAHARDVAERFSLQRMSRDVLALYAAGAVAVDVPDMPDPARASDALSGDPASISAWRGPAAHRTVANSETQTEAAAHAPAKLGGAGLR